jgi:hypothetical protein
MYEAITRKQAYIIFFLGKAYSILNIPRNGIGAVCGMPLMFLLYVSFGRTYPIKTVP